MRWASTCGTDCKEYSTQEQKADGTWYTVKAKFRKYPTIADGIKGYYEFLNYSRYKNLKGITDTGSPAGLSGKMDEPQTCPISPS